MFIGPFNGYGIEQIATDMPNFGIFLQVESATTTAIPRGRLCAWDLVDNQAVAGIMRETRGLRIKIHPTVAIGTANPNRPAGVTIAEIPANANAASSRSALVVICAYGPMGALAADTSANGNMIAGDPIIMSDTTAGMFNGIETEGAPSADERNKAVGFSYQVVAAAGAAGVLFKGFVNCMANQ